MERCDINVMINEVLTGQTSVANKKDLYLKKNLDARLPFINAHHDKLSQVIVNLVDNAIILCRLRYAEYSLLLSQTI